MMSRMISNPATFNPMIRDLIRSDPFTMIQRDPRFRSSLVSPLASMQSFDPAFDLIEKEKVIKIDI